MMDEAAIEGIHDEDVNMLDIAGGYTSTRISTIVLMEAGSGGDLESAIDTTLSPAQAITEQ